MGTQRIMCGFAAAALGWLPEDVAAEVIPPQGDTPDVLLLVRRPAQRLQTSAVGQSGQ